MGLLRIGADADRAEGVVWLLGSVMVGGLLTTAVCFVLSTNCRRDKKFRLCGADRILCLAKLVLISAI